MPDAVKGIADRFEFVADAPENGCVLRIGFEARATRKCIPSVLGVVGDLTSIFETVAEHPAHEQCVVGDVVQHQAFASAAKFAVVVTLLYLQCHPQTGDGFDSMTFGSVERNKHVHARKARKQLADVIHECRLSESLFVESVLNVTAKE